MNKKTLKNLGIMSLLTCSLTFSLTGCSLLSNDSKNDVFINVEKEINEITKNNELNTGKNYVKLPFETNDYKGSGFNEYNEKWNIYYKGDYNNFILNDSKGSFYSGVTDSNFNKGITKSNFLIEKPDSLSYIEKSSGLYDIKSDEYLVYKENDMYIYYFFDTINSNQLRSVLGIPIDIENQKEGFFGKVSNDYRESMENLMVDLINADRVSNGLSKLEYDKKLNLTSRLHSKDMIDNNYFDHVNLKGESVKDRMEKDGFNESIYGENIAFGQFSSIFAHEALMNSAGHRENILNPDYTHVGVGIEFDKDNMPYYTINFYAE